MYGSGPMADRGEPPRRGSAPRELLVVLPNRLNVGGGQEQDLLDLVGKLARDAFRVTVAEFDTFFREESRISDAEIARRLGNVRRVTIPTIAGMRRLTSIPTLRGAHRLRNLFMSADLVITCPFYLEDAVVALVARVTDHTLVASQDNPFLHRVAGSPKQALQDAWNRTVGVRLLRRMAGVRVLSHDEERALNRFGIARTIVLFPTPGVGLSREGEPELQRPMSRPSVGDGLTEPSLRVLVAGRMTLQKGVATVAEILERIRTRPGGFERLHFFFAGTRRLPPAIASYATQFPQNIENLGFVLGLDTVFQRMDVLLMPSLYESLGMSAVAAIRSGVPVIASDISGLREVVEPGRTGWLVPPRDADGFLRALDACLELMTSRATEWNALRAACRKLYEMRFGVGAREQQFDQFLGWLNDIGRSPSTTVTRSESQG